jgi:hypothetical protein
MRGHTDIGRRIAVATASAVAIGLFALTGASAASSAPGWQDVPGSGPDVGMPVAAAGRVWLVSGTHIGHGDLRSAPITNGRIGAWKTSSSGATSMYEGVLGDELVYADTADPTAPPAAIQLLPNGTAAAPTDLGGAPFGSPAVQNLRPTRVVQLPDRAVRLVGITNPRHEFAPDVGACCSTDGKVADYASLVSRGSTTFLGADRRGRLWLGWSGANFSREGVRIVELDPGSLKPRGAVAAVPGVERARIDAVVCGDSCRLLIDAMPTGARGFPLLSWAPGERSPTELRLRSGSPSSPIALIAARDDANGLLIAYCYGGGDYAPITIGLARGDSRGGGLKVIASIQAPNALGRGRNSVSAVGLPVGGLGADGLEAGLHYFGGYPERSVLRLAYLPLR